MDFVSLIGPGGVLWKAWVAAHWDRRLKRHDYMTADVKATTGLVLERLRETPLRCVGHIMLGICRILRWQASALEEEADEVRNALLTSLASGPGLAKVAAVSASAVTLRHQTGEAPSLDLGVGAGSLDMLMEPELPALEVEASLQEGRRHVAPLELITLSPGTPRRPPELPSFRDSEGFGEGFGAASAEDYAAMAAVGEAALQLPAGNSPASPDKGATDEEPPALDFLLGASPGAPGAPDFDGGSLDCGGDVVMGGLDDDAAMAAIAADAADVASMELPPSAEDVDDAAEERTGGETAEEKEEDQELALVQLWQLAAIPYTIIFSFLTAIAMISRAVILCAMARLTFVFCTSSSSSVGAPEELASLGAALETDDQCAAGDDDCALNALQLRGNALAEAGKEGEEAKDAEAEANMEAYWSENSCFAAPKSYGLAFKAQGSSFFDEFTFMTVDETHGAQRYLPKEEAFSKGVVETSEEHGTILRIGDVEPSDAPNAPFKRQSVMLHSNVAWSPNDGMLVVMKYNHVPYGAGVWPAFWLMNSDVLWPNGGEFDVLEYANDEVSKVTFHTNRNCFLDQGKLGQCMRGKPTGGPGPSNCNTDYFKNLLGCRPRQMQRSGEWFAKNPGVMAAAWDADGVTVYHIPNAEIPADLSSDKPKPETWGRFVLAYVPLDRGSCADVAKPQEIVLNIALCGDWAGGAWLKSSAARRTGFTHGCVSDIGNPAGDCCSKFVTENTTNVNGYMKNRAYFSIDYMKVFTPEGVLQAPPLESATFKRGGVPLQG